jgi:hypothetical protein
MPVCANCFGELNPIVMPFVFTCSRCHLPEKECTCPQYRRSPREVIN